MTKLQDELMETIIGVRDGSVPLKTGEVVQDLAYTIAIDKHADARQFELGVRQAELRKSLQAMDKVA